MSKTLEITTFLPNGTVTTDLRPGHTVEGLTHLKDPFIRFHRVPLSRVGAYLARMEQSVG